MPMKVTTQAMIMAPSAAAPDMLAGRLNEPPPIIELMTTPVSRGRPSLRVSGWALSSVALGRGGGSRFGPLYFSVYGAKLAAVWPAAYASKTEKR